MFDVPGNSLAHVHGCFDCDDPPTADTDIHNISGLAQDCGNSSALAMELPQSCAEPSI